MRTQTRLDSFRSVRLVVPAALLVFAACVACSRGGAAQNEGNQKPPMYADPQAAATRGLDTLRKLVTADNARDLGFDSPADVTNATLGQPLRVQMVRLDALRQYQPGGDPAALLTDANRMIFPVTARDQVRSSIVVEGSGNQWKASSFGGPHLGRQVARYRTEIAARATATPESMTVVHVAALNLYFLGFRDDGRLMLTPIENHPNYKLEAGSALPAEQVFAVLAPIAKNYNGLPL